MLIQHKLPLVAGLIISISLVIMSTVYYVAVSKEMTSQNEKQIENLLSTAKISFENVLKDRVQELDYLSESVLVQSTLKAYNESPTKDPEVLKDDYSQLDAYFREVLATRPDMRDLFVLSQGGIAIASNDPGAVGLDLSFRAYYQNAMKDQRTISTLLQDKMYNENVLFVAVPIHDTQDSEIIGVIASIIDRSETSKLLSQLVDPSIGSAYLVDKNGVIIYHLNDSLVGTKHVGVLKGNTDIIQIFEAAETQTGDLTYTYEGNDYYMAYQSIVLGSNGDEWILVIEQNTDLLYASIYNLRTFVLLTTMVMILVTVLAFSKFAKTITKPISHLSKVVNETTKGNLSIRSDYVHTNELGQFSSKLNDMLDEIIAAYEEVEDKNRELEISRNQLHTMAFTHPLTKMSNRTAFRNEIKEHMANHHQQDQHFYIYQLDIDHFMRINESQGHAFGDQVLMRIGNELKSVVSKDMLLYHLSEDEFAFVDYKSEDEVAVSHKAEEIFDLFGKPLLIDGRTMTITISMGISAYPEDTSDPQRLIQYANTAMFEAKNKGRGVFVFYNKLMSESVQKRLLIEEMLRNAVDKELVTMHFQPQVSTKDQSIVSFEALMRMRDLAGNSISPVDFIPVAEETGMIHEIGFWAIDYVCQVMESWKEKGYFITHLDVNVSVIQLNHPDFYQRVAELMNKYKIDPHELELEVTESIFFDGSKDNDVLDRLKNLGVRISLDDFGTGYSSFSYLSKMPLDVLKIDKSFIDNIEVSKKDRDVVRQMIDTSHDLSLVVIAEGVETEGQYHLLKEMNVDCIQGYYFSKPLPLEEAEALIKG